MSRSKKIVWIDDNGLRERVAVELGAEFINVKTGNFETTIEGLLRGKEPRLVILDHILDKTATTNPLFKRGSTIAEAIKEQWPSCPVIGVTNVSNIDGISLRTRQAYDVLFSYHKFGDYLNRIEAIEKGFALITKKAPASALEVVQLLKPPDEEMDRLVAALPDDLKKSSPDASVGSRLYRWVEHLLNRPGFLYDRMWAATLLGLNEAGFAKVVKEFDKGKYGGVFSTPNDPRWWTSRLTELLFKICLPEPGEFSWEAGRRLKGINLRFYSRCYRCNEDYPETVAYLDTQSDEQRPMHLKCTVLHPSYNRELYFEDVRVMKEK